MSYIENQSTALRMISEKGRAMTIERVLESTYDPDTSTTTEAAPVSIPVQGVVFPLSRGLRMAEGSSVQVGDQQLLLPAVDDAGNELVLHLDDHVDIGGKVYTIIDAALLSPGGVPILWDCVIRGGA
jgi:hypothetical protein